MREKAGAEKMIHCNQAPPRKKGGKRKSQTVRALYEGGDEEGPQKRRNFREKKIWESRQSPGQEKERVLTTREKAMERDRVGLNCGGDLILGLGGSGEKRRGQ